MSKEDKLIELDRLMRRLNEAREQCSYDKMASLSLEIIKISLMLEVEK